MASATALPLPLSIAAAAPNLRSGAFSRTKAAQGPCLCIHKKFESHKMISNRNKVMMMNGSSSRKDQTLAGLTALAVAAAMVIPEMAEAASPGVSPSLKNFLLSVASGGVVVAVLGTAVVGVSNFDPVKRS